MSILTYFHKSSTPRDNQRAILLEVERCWDSSEVIFLIAPTAAGKSKLAHCIATWSSAEKRLPCAWVTPNNMLLEEIKATGYESLYLLEAKTKVICPEYELPVAEVSPTQCDVVGCRKARCPYIKQFSAGKGKARAMNLMMYYVTNNRDGKDGKAGKDTRKKEALIVDEGHTLSGFLRNIWQMKLPLSEFPFLADLTGLEDGTCDTQMLLAVLEDSVDDSCLSNKSLHVVNALLDELRAGYGKYIISFDYGQQGKYLKLLPIDMSEAYQTCFSNINKLVLMSATLSQDLIKELGLQNKRSTVITGDSPIPVSCRPVVVHPIITSSRTSSEKDIQELVVQLEQLCKYHETEKGLIHSTYAYATKIKAACKASKYLQARLIYHTVDDKTTRFNEWKRTKDKILVASGMTEGLDLVDDLCRFQVITKIPWLSLEDEVVAAKLKIDEDWYCWIAAQHVMQAAGRVCRTPTDYGVTYVLDKSFTRLEHKLLDWFKQACLDVSGMPYTFKEIL